MCDIISFDEARRILQERPAWFLARPAPYNPRPKKPGECPICGYPQGTPGFLVADVPVGHPLFGVLIRCPACWNGYLPEYLRKISGLSPTMLNWRLENIVAEDGLQKATEAAWQFIKRPVGWLTVWGGFGRGKTYILACIINALREKQVAGMYIVAPEFLDRLRATYEPDTPIGFNKLFAQVRDIPVLALDELGQVQATDWANDKLFQLLDYRYRHRLGTVIALHFDPAGKAVPPQFPLRFQAILSRIKEFPCVELSGGDVRGLLRKEA